MPGAIFTLGYASRSMDQVLTVLQEEKTEFLIDVRSNPVSKSRPEFSIRTLENALKPVGIRYVFMGDALGGRPPDPTCYENGFVVYELVQEKAFFQAGIERLVEAAAKGLKLCLLCSEARPQDCHRSKMIGVALAARGVTVTHVDADGEHVEQNAVMARLESAQTNLFGESLSSRKAYRTG